MPAMTTAAAIAATSRLVSPIVTDLYRATTGKVQKEIAKWSSTKEIRAISKTLLKIENVKTLWSPDKEVSIQGFYHPSKIQDNGRPRGVASIDDLPDGNITIQGIVGQGKSIFMRYLASTAIRSSKQAKIPLFIELRSLSTKQDLSNLLFRTLENIGVNASADTFAYLADSGRMILFLDGFDETKEECVTELLAEIESLQVRHPELRLIVSSRPGNEIQKITGFRIVELSALVPSDYPAFLECLGLDAVKRKELTSAISKCPSNITGIIRTPLMMTLLVMVYETEREIPPTLPEFFERLFQVVFTRHDRLKANFNRKHHSGLSERRLQTLFEAFCFMSLQYGFGRTLTREQFVESFDLALQYTEDCKCDVEKFRLDITKVACLMLEEGVDLATFIHKSIQEYHAASFIKHSPDEVAKLFYREAMVSYRQWAEVLGFLKEIDPYRYARDYALNEIPPLAGTLREILNAKDEKSLIAFIETHQPGISMTVFFDDISIQGQNRVRRSYGPVSPPVAACLEPLADVIIECMSEAVPHGTSDSSVRAILTNEHHGRSTNETEKVARISFDTLIRYGGGKEFWTGLSRFDNYLDREITRANALVESKERRKLIFGTKAAAKEPK